MSILPFSLLTGGDFRIEEDSFSELMLANGWVRQDHLTEAKAIAPRSGIALPDVLIARGWADPEQVAAAKADCMNLGYADLRRDPPDPSVARPEDLDLCLRYRILPWRRVGSIMAYVTAEPLRAREAVGALQSLHGIAFFLVASRPAVDQAMLDLFGSELADRAVRRTPAQLSVRTLGAQRYGLLAVLGLGLSVALASATTALAAIGFLLLLLCTVTTITRLAVLLVSRKRVPIRATREGAVVLADHRPLPKISLLVPLYDEVAMIAPLTESLRRLDYPPECLDVKLLLEANDLKTIHAALQMDLPPWITPIILPDGAPRTKPRAMNLALDFCDGDVIGIFDAEDTPDRDQLRVVAEYFQSAPPEVASVQCQLTFFNSQENWITRCFQIEYAIWFDVLLRGWERLGLPVPLGGTSVYFRVSALRRLGGWDAHNVTEDADLGMRLARFGLKTAVVTSTTQEEANCKMLPWIRQRSRWLKGFMMTWLCHMRTPRTLLRELGPGGFFGFQVLFLGGAASYLAMPLFWASITMMVITGDSVYGPAMPDWALAALAFVLVLGQAVMLSSAVLALHRREQLALLAWVPTLVIYWTVGAAAAWKAVIELAFAPYYWDKTTHGISKVSAPSEGSL
ncbi:MAG: glycosyltransferase family 2 protein [Pseudomonadota bacterium]